MEEGVLRFKALSEELPFLHASEEPGQWLAAFPMSGDLLPWERDEGEAPMPLNLLSSRLRHSMGSEKKASGCWKLSLGVPQLEISLLSVDPLACPDVPSGHFVLVLLFGPSTPISGSVVNLCYPFNDFTTHSVHKRVSVNNLQLFCWQNSVFFKDLQRLPQIFPFSLPQCQCTPVLFLCQKGSIPFVCTLGSWILLLFAGSEQNRSIFLGKLWQKQF